MPDAWDDALDSQIHRWYTNPPKVWPKKPYYSPSSVNSCPRELYVKAAGAKRDIQRKPPHQGRWTRLGTSVGDMIQRDLLFIEKHYEAKTGNAPRFRLERNEAGQPMFEQFAAVNKRIEHGGEEFHLYGMPDGILTYTTDDGEQIRVGLEIKSKMTTPARTSAFSMKAPDESHAAQTVAYSAMFDVDYYVILYVNAAKQGWFMTDEQYAKTPDIRAFCRRITDADRTALFDKLAAQTRAQRTGNPPELDIEKWTFNNFKAACASSLSDEEYADIRKTVKRVMNSNLPERKKADYARVLADIERLRANE